MKAARAILALLYFFFFKLSLCGAGKINCNVSQSAEGTSYSIPDVDASGCDYSWSTKNNTGKTYVLATGTRNRDKDVKNESISNLVTFKCFPKIFYDRTCDSENKEEMTSVCEIDCREIEKMIKEDQPSNSVKTTVFCTVAGVFGMVLVAGGLIYKFRNRLKSVNVNERKDNLI